MKKISKELINEGVERAGKKLGLSRLKKSALKLYLKSPKRVQVAIAKRGVKSAVNRKTSELLDLIKV